MTRKPFPLRIARRGLAQFPIPAPSGLFLMGWFNMLQPRWRRFAAVSCEAEGMIHHRMALPTWVTHQMQVPRTREHFIRPFQGLDLEHHCGSLLYKHTWCYTRCNQLKDV